MVLKKVIKSYQIDSKYETFVNEFFIRLSNEIDSNLHSLYICGSIPKGRAQAYKSDADFTIVCRDLDQFTNMDVINKIKSDLLNDFPYITKIDTTFISVNDVTSKPLEWGFWIKIICYCIHGQDLGENVPPLKPNSDLIIALLSDFMKPITRLNHKLENLNDPDEIVKTIRGYSKRLIRNFYTLILEDVREWKDDILDMKNALNYYMQENKELIDCLYYYYSNRDSNKLAFQTYADQACLIISKRLETLSKDV